jgi:amino acid permease
MISLNFGLAISIYFVATLGVVFFLWLFNKKEQDRDIFLDPKFIWFCSVCTYTYVNTKEETISACPRCKSYNKKSS